MTHPLVERACKTLSRFQMISPGERLLVAVSGGPDSTALLHFLWTHREEWGISLVVGHLHHGIRGREADEEADFVSALCQDWGIPCKVGKTDVPSLRFTKHWTMQEAARYARYEFLLKTAVEYQAQAIATAHTADDQAETVLMALLRGAGPRGLAGIPPLSERRVGDATLKIIRPFLEVWRTEVLDYCQAHALSFREDSSNRKTLYLRNRVRHHLIPLLSAEYNSKIKMALCRLGDILREEDRYLRAQAISLLSTLLEPGDAFSFQLKREGLPKDLALLRRVLYEALQCLEVEPTWDSIQRLVEALQSPSLPSFTLPGALMVSVHPEALSLQKAGKASPPSFDVPLEIPGVIDLPDLQLRIEALLLSKEEESSYPLLEAGSAKLDYGRVKGPIRVRSWRPGDRLRPLGLGGTKKLQDLFVDRKVPRSERHKIPIFVDEEKILWVPGLALSEEVKVQDTTRQILFLRLLPLGNLVSF